MSIKVAVVGVGNCASSFVQGTVHYKDKDFSEPFVPGLIRPRIGPYLPGDVEFVAAFDADRAKIGRRLDEAIFLGRNNTIRLVEAMPMILVEVQPSPVMDGFGEEYRKEAQAWEGSPDAERGRIVRTLRDSGAELIVSYLPVGSDAATEWWARVALEAGCGMVNCIPSFVASRESPEFRDAFRAAGLPLLGDDVKSQVGATIVHRMLTELMGRRGFKILRTYQLNFGGNMDFKNMLQHSRLASKKKSKAGAVMSELRHPMDPRDVHISPSDYVAWLEDRKWAMIRIEAEAFGGAPMALELKLEVWDSPNSAGVVTDLVRVAKLQLDRGEGGILLPAAACYMKSPPVQMEEAVADLELDAWIAG